VIIAHPKNNESTPAATVWLADLHRQLAALADDADVRAMLQSDRGRAA